MFIVEPQDDQHLQGANRRRSREDEGTSLRAERWSIHGKLLPFPNVEWPRHTDGELELGSALPDVSRLRVIVR
jgi:hypothetical protein